MNKFSKFFIGTGLLVLLIVPRPAWSQSEPASSCPQLVTTAINVTGEACSVVSRNEVCYGHAMIEASPQPGANLSDFSNTGDIADIDDLRSMRLSPMDEQAGLWGISLLRLQASLPDNIPGQNVTLVVFGDVALENAAEETTPVDVTIAGPANLNVRILPRIGAYVMAALAPGDTIAANGRLVDNSWLRVTLPSTGETGWISNHNIDTDPALLETLAVVDNTSPYYRPMQAFFFQSGSDDSLCPEAPNSGLLIQTPEGISEVRFLVNEVSIRLISTVLIQTTPNNEMAVQLLEGSGTVTARGVSQILFPGTQVLVPLGPDNVPIGPPSFPRSYDLTQVQVALRSLLERPSPIVDPMTDAEINAQVIALFGESPVHATVPPCLDEDGQPVDELTDLENEALPDGTLPDETLPDEERVDEPVDEPDDDTPPGLVDNPALGDDGPPGQTGNEPPGQDDELPPGQSKKD